ncbi:MAG: hypothetical protein U0X20_20590 [Caldilineaceae bacterium]
MSHSSPSLSVQDALDDIDMELLQDAVQRDDLGRSVQNVRRFQDDARKALDTSNKPDYRAIANRQFQLNEMLLALLQELSVRQRALELELRTHGGSAAGDQVPASASGAPGEDGAARPLSEDLVRQLDAIQTVMHDDALRLQLEVTPSETPVVGRLLGSLRAAVHSLVVFYGNQLAAKQTEVNRVYGDVLQQLLLARAQDRTDAAAHLQAQAAEFSAELAALRTLLPAGDSDEEAKAS